MDATNKIQDYESLILDSVTDDELLNLAKNRFVLKPADFNLKAGARNSGSFLKPIPGGLYDGRIFGSIYEHKCNCGAIHEINIPCPECGTTVFDSIQRSIRYAIIDATVFYVTSAKLKPLINFLRKNFTIKLNIKSKILEGRCGLSNEKSALNLLYLTQPKYDKSENSITFYDEITDTKVASLEGLLDIIGKNKPELLDEYKKYVNRYVPVLPAILRKVKFFLIDGKKKLELPKSTAYYRSIIIAVDTLRSIRSTTDDPYKYMSFAANVRNYISKVLMRMSGLMKTSKESSIRNNYKINSAHSGRAVISGDPTLPIDTIKIPRILAYEMYKKQFLKYMKDQMNIPPTELAKRYNEPDEEIHKGFDEFCKDKVVVINRPPTLHAQNFQCYKLQLSEDYGIHFPLLTTAAQNADFDGDAVMFFAVPDDLKDYVYERCSPSMYTNYPSDGSPILKPRHEILYGLTIATKIIDNNENRSYICFDDLESAINNDEVWVNDLVDICGNPTTYGREVVAKILKVPSLDEIIGMESINAKNIADIFTIINSRLPEERVKILYELQKFALEIVTLEGATSINIRELYYDVPEDFKNRINNVINSDMDEKDKIREIEEIHGELVEDLMSKGLSKETQDRINEGNRGKMSAIESMLVPAFYIDSNGKLFSSENSLIHGLTEIEYLIHTLSNRESLLTKAGMVPFSGYLCRQLKESGSTKILIKDAVDDTNKGLLIPAKYAEDRYDLQGNVYGKSKSDELVRVKSCITTELSYLTADMFRSTNKYTYDNDGRCALGYDYMTSFASDVTQSGLSLKHVTSSRFIMEMDKFYAPYDTEVEYTDDLIILKSTGDKYIRPTKWTTKGNGFYKAGELIGEVPKFYTITVNVESLVKLFGAQGNLKTPGMSNKIKFRDCFTRTNPHHLRYKNGIVSIGGMKWKRDSRFIWYPIDSKIPPMTRFCSGLQDIKSLDNQPLDTRFNIFLQQVRELRECNIEVVEMLFSMLTNNGKKYSSVTKVNTKENTSALSALGYGYSKQAVNRIVEGDLKVNAKDMITEILIPPIMFKLIEASKN